MSLIRRMAGIAGAATLAFTVTSSTGAAAVAAQPQPVIFVGSNWAGTVDVIRPAGDYQRLGQINVVPDLDQRMMEIYTDPARLAYFLLIRMLVGEGHDQLVDDMYSSADGRLLVASRPSLADVVAIDTRSGELVWRFRVDGQRSDHMALSPDGKHVAVSASTGNVVHVLDVATGKEVGRFPSGDSPHENVYSPDGERIYHASIGLVYTPLDQPAFDTTKGQRVFQVVDASTFDVLERVDLREKLDAAGHHELSSAIRPMAHTPDERFFYFQLSFFHGFVEYDRQTGTITRVASLPNHVPDMPREQYVNDSAHHGIAMNRTGSKLCVAGTMDDYAAIVSRKTLDHRIVADRADVGGKPYWATTSADGGKCYVSWSGADQISVFSYRSEREIARVDVGDHPQRIREGVLPAGWRSP
ncbi:MAG: YncE family protein [Thermocrispum sp.]